MPSIRSGSSTVRASACITATSAAVRTSSNSASRRAVSVAYLRRKWSARSTGPAGAAVLVAGVGPAHGRPRHVEVVMGGEPGGPGRAGGDDRERLGLGRAGDGAAEPGEVAKGGRRVPAREPLRPRRIGRRGGERALEVALERDQVVGLDLHPHQEAVERRHVGADRVDPERVRLDERRPRSGERVVDDGAGREAAAKQRLGQLRHELAEIGVQAMDVLRPQALRQVALRPRELVVDLGVERRLRAAGHGRPRYR